MKKTYQIRRTIVNHPELGDLVKYFTHYFENGVEVLVEFHSTDGVTGYTHPGYEYEKYLDLTNTDDLKEYLITKIDLKTQEVIAEGFTFDNIVFSLSQNAQLNITNIPNIPEQGFPFVYLGKNDEYYELTYSNRFNFYFTALNTIKTIRISNDALKTQCRALNTTEELNQFKTDNNL